MIPDPTPLQESIARALDPDARDLTMDHPYMWEAAMADAAAVLPIIAAEVRKGQADALRQAARDYWGNDHVLWTSPRVREKLTTRATDIEQED